MTTEEIAQRARDRLAQITPGQGDTVPPQNGVVLTLEDYNKLAAVVEAARALTAEPYYCGRVLTQALLDAQNDPEYADIVRDCLHDWRALRDLLG